MNIIRLTFLALFIISCSQDTVVDDKLLDYAGKYQIVSFMSDMAVDLNNDGVVNTELVYEIPDFDFRDLEIRPNQFTDNPTKLIRLFLPKANLTFNGTTNPEGYVEHTRDGFLTTYQFVGDSFILNDTTYIEYAHIDNVESNREVVLSQKIDIIDEKHLKTSIEKQYYDFSIGDWRVLNIDIIFQKVF